ncbi:YopT-type cysteine protease domain-containing protein [Novosphingobium sp.]|uniref:YopT-type cysteine protease domain-containing protein n=1 Tax=Novosphingobium sp. TaxID=1874826 RepID=UPI0025F27182|nr:YopT-type cysteine protease domain-containing protein [Novosphingobium sp.]
MVSESTGYNYVRFDGPNTNAHGIGIYSAGASFVMFDANFGQYRFPTKQAFVAFLKKFLPRSGYGRMFTRMGLLQITASN